MTEPKHAAPPHDLAPSPECAGQVGPGSWQLARLMQQQQLPLLLTLRQHYQSQPMMLLLLERGVGCVGWLRPLLLRSEGCYPSLPGAWLDHESLASDPEADSVHDQLTADPHARSAKMQAPSPVRAHLHPTDHHDHLALTGLITTRHPLLGPRDVG